MGLAQLHHYCQVKVAWSIAKPHKFLAYVAYTLVYEDAIKTVLHSNATKPPDYFLIAVTVSSHPSINDETCYCPKCVLSWLDMFLFLSLSKGCALFVVYDVQLSVPVQGLSNRPDLLPVYGVL